MVAEKVMGYRWYENKTNGVAFLQYPEWFDMNPSGTDWFSLLRDGPHPEQDRDYKHVPLYAENFDLAFNVEVQMRADGFWMILKSPFNPNGQIFKSSQLRGDVWNAGFTMHGTTGWNGQPDFRGQGPTAQVAICVAALLAKGVSDLVIAPLLGAT